MEHATARPVSVHRLQARRGEDPSWALCLTKPSNHRRACPCLAVLWAHLTPRPIQQVQRGGCAVSARARCHQKNRATEPPAAGHGLHPTVKPQTLSGVGSVPVGCETPDLSNGYVPLPVEAKSLCFFFLWQRKYRLSARTVSSQWLYTGLLCWTPRRFVVENFPNAR